ncbi:hypothetical protein SH528x_002190 [Novipirellula sp. SH528]|uniref:hypothetical protein n=1 Tax=Novipirellula sp. SH528 TaxID=3454466 RepID=UPI003FA0DB65
MNSTLVTQRVEQFDAKHGTPASDGSWFYYADGAKREQSPYGALYEPSNDPRQRLETVVWYRKIRLDHVAAEFDETKQRIKQHDLRTQSETQIEASIRTLQTLQRRVRHAAEKYGEAADELKKVMPGYRTPEEEAENQRQLAEADAKRSAYESTINAINI